MLGTVKSISPADAGATFDRAGTAVKVAREIAPILAERASRWGENHKLVAENKQLVEE
jgi:hypothetical protein